VTAPLRTGSIRWTPRTTSAAGWALASRTTWSVPPRHASAEDVPSDRGGVPNSRGTATWAALDRLERARREREPRLQELSDKELIAHYLAATEGTQRSAWLHELFRRHYAKVLTWCMRFTGNRDDASDLAQAVFAKAQRHLATFRGESRVSTWLYAITRSECMTWLQRQRGRPDALDAETLEELDDAGEASPQLALERAGDAKVVHALLDEALDDTEKTVFTLHYGDDVPLDVITRLLGLTNRSGAKGFIVRARRKLARAVALWKARDQALDA
jgi:RNA polymerase sigma-70 factor, ECF subfamily